MKKERNTLYEHEKRTVSTVKTIDTVPYNIGYKPPEKRINCLLYHQQYRVIPM